MPPLSGVIFLLQAFASTIVYAQNSLFIRDYFAYKNVTRVAGFSCGDMDDDLDTMRLLNDLGITAAIKPAGFRFNITKYLETHRTLGVFVDIRCPDQNVSGIYDVATIHFKFDFAYNWLILGSNLSHSVNTLNDSLFSVITDFVIALPDNASNYVLYDVYNQYRLRGGILNITRFGTWQMDDGLTVALTDSRVARRCNFNRMRLKTAGIVIYRPENVKLVNYLEDDSTEIMDHWPKFGFAMLSHLSDIYNFTMDLIEITHWEKNDSTGPVMGALHKDNADLAYYPSILSMSRFEVARVIVQLMPTRTCFMFRTIPASKMKSWVMLKPFAADTWYVIVAMVVMMVFSMSFILRLESVKEYDNCSVSAIIAVAALCQQGYPTLSDQSASRVAFIQIMVFGLLVYNYYSAAVVSARLNEPLQKMNDSLISLAHSNMKFAAERNLFFDFLLTNPKSEVKYFKRYWDNVPESQRFLSVQEGTQKIMQGGFAYHADPDDIYRFIDREFSKEMICQLTEVHLLPPTEIGLWTTHKSHFHEIAKRGLIRIATSGLRRREVRRRMGRKPYCPTEEIFVSSVTIYEVAPMLIFLLIGMTISLILFAIENLVFYMMHPKQAIPLVSLKKSKILLKGKESILKNHNTEIHQKCKTLPKASTLFQGAAITKR